MPDTVLEKPATDDLTQPGAGCYVWMDEGRNPVAPAAGASVSHHRCDPSYSRFEDAGRARRFVESWISKVLAGLFVFAGLITGFLAFLVGTDYIEGKPHTNTNCFFEASSPCSVTPAATGREFLLWLTAFFISLAGSCAFFACFTVYQRRRDELRRWWLTTHGTDNQRARDKEKLLPRSEVDRALESFVFSPLSRFIHFAELKELTSKAGECSAHQWGVIDEMRRAMPQADIQLRTDSDDFVRVKARFGGFRFVRDYKSRRQTREESADKT